MSVGILIVIIVAILSLAIAWLYFNYFTKKKFTIESESKKVKQELVVAEPNLVTEPIELAKAESEQTSLTEESPQASNTKAETSEETSRAKAKELVQASQAKEPELTSHVKAKEPQQAFLAKEPEQAFQAIANEEEQTSRTKVLEQSKSKTKRALKKSADLTTPQQTLDRELKQKKPVKIVNDKLSNEGTPIYETLKEELPKQKKVEQQPSEQTEQKSLKKSSPKKSSSKQKLPKKNPPEQEILLQSSENKIIHPVKLEIIHSYVSLHEAGSKNAIRALLSAGIGKLTEDSEVMEVLDEIERRVGKNVLGDDAYTSIYEYGFVDFFKKINLKMLMDYGVEGSIDQLKDETP